MLGVSYEERHIMVQQTQVTRAHLFYGSLEDRHGKARKSPSDRHPLQEIKVHMAEWSMCGEFKKDRPCSLWIIV